MTTDRKGRPAERTRPRDAGGLTLLVPETKERFLAALRTGVPIKTAAAHAGVSESAANKWLVNGRKAEAKEERGERLSEYERRCRDLLGEVQRTMEGVHVLLAGRVVQASEEDWKAASWMLQRRHPAIWGAAERVELSGPGGGPIAVEAILARAEERLETVIVEPRPNGQHELDEG